MPQQRAPRSRVRLAAVLLAAALAPLLAPMPGPAGALEPSEASPASKSRPISVAAARQELDAARRASTKAAGQARQARSQSLAASRAAQAWALAAQAAHERARGAQQSVDTMARDLYVSGASLSPLVVLVTSGQRDDAGRLATYERLSWRVGQDVADALDALRARDALTSAASSAAQELTAASARLDQALQGQEQADARTQQALLAYRSAVQPLMPPPGPPVGDVASCPNSLARLLLRAGFTGQDNREAWAIVMRESGGNPRSVSGTDDWGLFQFNRPTWGTQDWWDDDLMLDASYNASIAAMISRSGRTWLNWGLDGHGGVRASLYENVGWTPQMIQDRIATPFAKWYAKYPCTQAAPVGTGNG